MPSVTLLTSNERISLVERFERELQSEGTFFISVAAEQRTSPFFHALALSALSVSKSDRTTELCDLMSHRLGQEWNRNGSLNYAFRGSAEALAHPYPDDLDTTSCGYLAAMNTAPDFLTGKRLAAYVKLLMAVEVEPGGPYKTWLVSESADEAWKDIDPCVNANIAAVLAHEKMELPGLDAYLWRVLDDRTIQSPYYPSRISFLYFLSRTKKETFAPRITTELLEQVPERCNPLECAMIISSLVRMGERALAEPYYERMVERVRTSSVFAPYPFCIDRILKGEVRYAGAIALTIACILEADALYAVPSGREPIEEIGGDLKMLSDVERVVRDRFNLAGDDVGIIARGVIDECLRGDPQGEKSLLPYLFAVAWGREEELDHDWMIKLCAAHFMGWMAYTIYDDVLDDELQKPHLPVANICLRELTRLFDEYLPIDLVRSVLDTVENANAWEVTHCRLPVSVLPDFGNGERFVERSWGVVLGPLAIASKLGYAPESEEMKALEQFFYHYILAKQLNDDAHDWEADLLKGAINGVSVRLLARVPGAIDSPALHMDEMKNLFWHEVLDQVSTDILAHVEEGRKALDHFPEHARSFFLKLLEPFVRSAEQAMKERDKTLAFLQALDLK